MRASRSFPTLGEIRNHLEHLSSTLSCARFSETASPRLRCGFSGPLNRCKQQRRGIRHAPVDNLREGPFGRLCCGHE
jgi:hypothetical protein